MEPIKSLFLSSLFSLLVFQSEAITKVDSLEQLYSQAKTDSARLAINNEVIWKFLFTDKVRAKELIQKSETLLKRKNTEHGYVTLLGIKGVYFDVNGEQDSAKFYFEEGLRLSRFYKMPLQEEYALNNLGMYYWNRNQNEKALEYFFQSLSINDRLKGKKIDRANNYNNIGLIYQNMALYDQAIRYHKKSLEIRLQSNDSVRVLSSYVNLGECYKSLGESSKAREMYRRGMTMSELISGKPEFYKFVEGIAHLHLEEGQFDQALSMYFSSLNRPESYPISSKEKRFLYTQITETLVRMNRLQEAQKYGELGLEILGDSKETELYKWLAIAYIRSGKLNQGYALMDQYFEATQEKFQMKSARALQELKVKYETEKSQRALAENRILADRKQIQLLQTIGISAFFVLGLIVIIAWQKRRNRKLKELRHLQQLQFDMKNAESLHIQKLKIAHDLHDNVGSQLTFIVSSMENLLLQKSKDASMLHEKIRSLSTFTRKAIIEMRDMLWGLKNERIQLPELQERILSFINSVNDLEIPIRITLDYSDEVEDDLNIDSVEGIHMLRFIQEAVNNAGKHAKCSEIKICIVRKSDAIRFRIIDDGVGFDLENTKQGNGLKSMKFRAEKLHARTAITSNEQGTTVELIVSIKNTKF